MAANGIKFFEKFVSSLTIDSVVLGIFDKIE